MSQILLVTFSSLAGTKRVRRIVGLLGLTVLAGLVACQITPAARSITADPPMPTTSPAPILSLTSLPIPMSTPTLVPIRALRVDYEYVEASRNEVAGLEQKMKEAGVNLVAIGAGRVDWTYFKWQGHEDVWSSDVRETNMDFLAEDAAHFSQWASVNVVVDVFAPRYIAAHPHTAAISWQGQPSHHLVSTMQLVEGDLGQQLLAMLDYLAAHYPVDSISITELSYYIEGYGDDDKAAYMRYTGRSDWPRLPNGLVNIDDPTIGEWRSYEISRFIAQAANIVHRYHKKLYVDVEVSWGHLEREATERGQNYGMLLQSADRLVLWDYFGLSGYEPEYTARIAQSVQKYGPDRIIISIGLWARNGVISPEALRRAMLAGLQSPIPNLWITPSLFLSDEHWQVIQELWSHN